MVRGFSCLSPIFVSTLLYLCDMITYETRQIDLHLPQSWNQCTTEELEIIAAAIIQEQRRVDRYHPFDWQRVKLNVVLAVNGITVLRDDDIPKGNAAAEWLVRRRTDKSPWPVSTGHLLALTEQLAWLDDEKATMPKIMFPYPQKIRRWSWRVWQRDYYAPGELLDGMTWQTYRWLNDWLEAYTATNNRLAAARHSASRIVREETKAFIQQERDIRLTVLSLIFGCPKWRIRTARFTEPQWQVVLFWWSSMMQYLRQQYPKCYKSSKIKKLKNAKATLPIELYTQSMAVLVTDLKLTEDEVNHLTAHVILRRLNTMALDAEEMERLRHKK